MSGIRTQHIIDYTPWRTDKVANGHGFFRGRLNALAFRIALLMARIISGIMICKTAGLLLLTCLAAGPYSMAITGVTIVTVGVPYAFLCSASCTPACSFSWTRGNQTSEGAELTLQLKALSPRELVTCMALNPATGRTATISKTMAVTAGPSNLRISGPPMLTLGVENIFTCTADCYPSCTFSWKWMWLEEILGTSSGDTVSIKPPETVDSETLFCEAVDTVSHLYISTSLQRYVARLTGIYITTETGEWTVTVGHVYTFTCYVACTPSCNYTWTFEGKKYGNDQIHIPVFRKGEQPMIENTQEITIAAYHRMEPLTCEAQNTVSGATISTTQMLTIINGPFKMKIVEVNKGPVGKELTALPGSITALQCVAECFPGCSISWFYNGKMLSKNISISFTPVTPPNRAALRCVAYDSLTMKNSSAETIVVVPYGPFKVKIVEVNKGPVGKELTALPGSITALQCVAECFPGCSISWFYNGKMLSKNVSISFTPVTPPNQAVLRCVAYDSLTMKNSSAETIVVVPYGPFKVKIVEVNKGPVGKELTALPGSITALQCVAECFPGCSISWFYNGKMLSKNVSISFTPVTPPNQAVLRCVAYDSLTMKNSSAETIVVVPYGPFKVKIVEVNKGPVGKELTALPGSITALQCVAECFPGCSISWFYNGKMLSKNASISFTPMTPPNQAVLRCVAYDSLTMKNSSAETIVVVPYGPFKVKIVEVNKGPVGKELTALPGSITALQCVAECFPGCSISWFYNGKMLSKNVSISFTPVTPPNQAVLRCVAYDSLTMKNSSAETIVVVPYGPFKVKIVEVNKGPVGKELTALPGSITALQCVAECFPGCSISWFYNGKMLSKNASISFTPVTPPNQAVLRCVAYDSLTMKNSSAETIVVVPYGPFKVKIVEVNKGPVGKELTALPGSITALQCVAECFPGCSISWFYNGKMLSKNASISFTPMTPPNQAVLRCVAYDSLTMKNSSAETIVVVPYGPFNVEIIEDKIGPVGKELTALPGSITAFQCIADCYPGCSFNWFYNDKMLSKNASISFTPVTPPNRAALRCVAFNSLTMKNSSAETIVVIPYGPFKVKIVEVNKGPVGKELTALPGSITALQCVAECFPGCSISWFYNGKMLSKNASISFTPVTPPNQAVLRCVAYDSLTMKNSSAETIVVVPYGPFNVEIIEDKIGPVGKELTALPGSITAFQCIADCYPGCSFNWFYNDKMLSKNASISFTPVTPPNRAALRCVAFNSLTMKNSSAETIVVIPYGPFKVKIVEVNKGPVGKELTALPGSITALQCVAECFPGCSISWFYNGKMLSKNASISFTPVTPPNQAVLRCVAYDSLTMKNSSAETIVVVPYGPFNVEIIEDKIGPVGKELTALPGSITAFQCIADCYPGCSFNWFYNDKMLSKNASISFTPVTPPNRAALRCVAFNSLTMKNSSVETTAIVPYGPVNVTILRSHSLEVGVKATFACTAMCIPACTYTWSVFGSPVKGSTIDITISRYVATESISCEAHNSVSGKTATANDTLTVSDPHWCGC
ncbi:Hemicentin-1 [Merluccius polli]|uniref:Hemicentin-1 n=1 Tax=Merluccius polli TaxID=89951 RepID=A0AA47P0Z9_MERPO|nr:Hemicentin-1 [Merluccius polli]